MVGGSIAARARNAPLNHIDQLAERAAPRSPFDQALLDYLQLAPRSGATGLCDGRRFAMVRALESRATWSQIREWKRGRRRAPQWAIDLLREKIAARRAELDRGLTSLSA